MIEQYFKNCVYFLLQKDNHENKYINRLINNKLPANKYSPNIKLDELEKQIKEFFEIEFKFILSKKIEPLKKYEDLVKSRHAYAHKGIFNFNFDNFEDAIAALEYIKYEIDFILENEEKRKKIQETFEKFKEYKKIKTCINILKKSKKEKKIKARENAKEEIKRLKIIIEELKELTGLDDEIKLLKNFFELLKKIENIDTEGLNDDLIINTFEKYIEITNDIFE